MVSGDRATEKPGSHLGGAGTGRSLEGGRDSMSRGTGWEGVGRREKTVPLVSPRGLGFMTPVLFKRLCFVLCHQSLPSVSCLAGPLCPGAATPPPSSSPPRRTRPWGQSLSTRWTPAASTTSTRRSSACSPRCFGQGSLGGAVWVGQWSQSSLTSVAMPMRFGTTLLCPLHTVVLVLLGHSLRLSRMSSGIPGGFRLAQ